MFEDLSESELISLASDKSTNVKDLLLLSLNSAGGVRVAVAGNPNTPSLAFDYLVKDSNVEVVDSLAGNPKLVEPHISQILGMFLEDEEIVEKISFNKSLSVLNMKIISEKYPFFVKNFVDNRNIPEEIISVYFYAAESEFVKTPEVYKNVLFKIISNPNTSLKILGRISKYGIKFKNNVLEQVRISQPMVSHLDDEELLEFLTQ